MILSISQPTDSLYREGWVTPQEQVTALSCLETTEKVSSKSQSVISVRGAESAVLIMDGIIKEKGIQPADVIRELTAQQKRIMLKVRIASIALLILGMLALALAFGMPFLLPGAAVAGLVVTLVLAAIVSPLLLAFGVAGLANSTRNNPMVDARSTYTQLKKILQDIGESDTLSTQQMQQIFKIADKTTTRNLLSKASLRQLAVSNPPHRTFERAVELLTSDRSYEEKKSLISKAEGVEAAVWSHIFKNPQLLSLDKRKMSLGKKMTHAIHYHHLRMDGFKEQSIVSMSSQFAEVLLETEVQNPQIEAREAALTRLYTIVDALPSERVSLTSTVKEIKTVFEFLKDPNQQLNDSEAKLLATGAMKYADRFFDSTHWIFTDEEIKALIEDINLRSEILTVRKQLKTRVIC